MSVKVTGISKALWDDSRGSNYTIYRIKKDFIVTLANELILDEKLESQAEKDVEV